MSVLPVDDSYGHEHADEDHCQESARHKADVFLTEDSGQNRAEQRTGVDQEDCVCNRRHQSRRNVETERQANTHATHDDREGNLSLPQIMEFSGNDRDEQEAKHRGGHTTKGQERTDNRFVFWEQSLCSATREGTNHCHTGSSNEDSDDTELVVHFVARLCGHLRPF